MSEIDPEIAHIPLELLEPAIRSTVVGIAILSFFVCNKRYPSSEELETGLQETLITQERNAQKLTQ